MSALLKPPRAAEEKAQTALAREKVDFIFNAFCKRREDTLTKGELKEFLVTTNPELRSQTEVVYKQAEETSGPEFAYLPAISPETLYQVYSEGGGDLDRHFTAVWQRFNSGEPFPVCHEAEPTKQDAGVPADHTMTNMAPNPAPGVCLSFWAALLGIMVATPASGNVVTATGGTEGRKHRAWELSLDEGVDDDDDEEEEEEEGTTLQTVAAPYEPASCQETAQEVEETTEILDGVEGWRDATEPLTETNEGGKCFGRDMLMELASLADKVAAKWAVKVEYRVQGEGRDQNVVLAVGPVEESSSSSSGSAPAQDVGVQVTSTITSGQDPAVQSVKGSRLRATCPPTSGPFINPSQEVLCEGTGAPTASPVPVHTWETGATSTSAVPTTLVTGTGPVPRLGSEERGAAGGARVGVPMFISEQYGHAAAACTTKLQDVPRGHNSGSAASPAAILATVCKDMPARDCGTAPCTMQATVPHSGPGAIVYPTSSQGNCAQMNPSYLEAPAVPKTPTTRLNMQHGGQSSSVSSPPVVRGPTSPSGFLSSHAPESLSVSPSLPDPKPTEGSWSVSYARSLSTMISDVVFASSDGNANRSSADVFTPEDKISIMFDCFDKNDDGIMTKDDLKLFLYCVEPKSLDGYVGFHMEHFLGEVGLPETLVVTRKRFINLHKAQKRDVETDFLMVCGRHPYRVLRCAAAMSLRQAGVPFSPPKDWLSPWKTVLDKMQEDYRQLPPAIQGMVRTATREQLEQCFTSHAGKLRSGSALENQATAGRSDLGMPLAPASDEPFKERYTIGPVEQPESVVRNTPAQVPTRTGQSTGSSVTSESRRFGSGEDQLATAVAAHQHSLELKMQELVKKVQVLTEVLSEGLVQAGESAEKAVVEQPLEGGKVGKGAKTAAKTMDTTGQVPQAEKALEAHEQRKSAVAAKVGSTDVSGGNAPVAEKEKKRGTEKHVEAEPERVERLTSDVRSRATTPYVVEGKERKRGAERRVEAEPERVERLTSDVRSRATTPYVLEGKERKRGTEKRVEAERERVERLTSDVRSRARTPYALEGKERKRGTERHVEAEPERAELLTTDVKFHTTSVVEVKERKRGTERHAKADPDRAEQFPSGVRSRATTPYVLEGKERKRGTEKRVEAERERVERFTSDRKSRATTPYLLEGKETKRAAERRVEAEPEQGEPCRSDVKSCAATHHLVEGKEKKKKAIERHLEGEAERVERVPAAFSSMSPRSLDEKERRKVEGYDRSELKSSGHHKRKEGQPVTRGELVPAPVIPLGRPQDLREERYPAREVGQGKADREKRGQHLPAKGPQVPAGREPLELKDHEEINSSTAPAEIADTKGSKASEAPKKQHPYLELAPKPSSFSSRPPTSRPATSRPATGRPPTSRPTTTSRNITPISYPPAEHPTRDLSPKTYAPMTPVAWGQAPVLGPEHHFSLPISPRAWNQSQQVPAAGPSGLASIKVKPVAASPNTSQQSKQHNYWPPTTQQPYAEAPNMNGIRVNYVPPCPTSPMAPTSPYAYWGSHGAQNWM